MIELVTVFRKWSIKEGGRCELICRNTLKTGQESIQKKKYSSYLSTDDIRDVVADVDRLVRLEHLQCHLQVGLVGGDSRTIVDLQLKYVRKRNTVLSTHLRIRQKYVKVPFAVRSVLHRLGFNRPQTHTAQ